MSPLVAQLNFYLALCTVLLQAGIVALVCDWYLFKGRNLFRYLAQYVRECAFLAACMAMLMTLLYSEVFGFVPCGLCWLERVFLYPQVVMLGVALWKKETRAIFDYGITLSLLGGIVSLYHHYIQMGGSEVVKCPTSGGDCAKRIIFEFEYVTFPLMAFTLFVFLIVIFTLARKNQDTLAPH